MQLLNGRGVNFKSLKAEELNRSSKYDANMPEDKLIEMIMDKYRNNIPFSRPEVKETPIEKTRQMKGVSKKRAE